MSGFHSPFLDLLKNRVSLRSIPFTERRSRLMVSLGATPGQLTPRLAERWPQPGDEPGSHQRRGTLAGEGRRANQKPRQGRRGFCSSKLQCRARAL